MTEPAIAASVFAVSALFAGMVVGSAILIGWH